MTGVTGARGLSEAGHVIVADLGYGDAGKGSTVDWLCSPAAGGERRGNRQTSARGSGPGPRFRAVVRFNGGAQAAHNVVTPEGVHHTFAQFGAGTLHGVPTFLSRFMLVDPFALAAEAAHLASVGVAQPFDLVTVDRRALITTPYHKAANRLREAARSREPGGERHGSCGMGIGETVAYSLAVPFDEAPRAGDCGNPVAMAAKLVRLRESLAADLALSGLALPGDLPSPQVCAEVYAAFAERTWIVGEEHLPRLLADGPCVFEGAQGVLLDEWFGFHPHTTWSTTTFANARTLLGDAGLSPDDAFRLGVVRTYTTRHGAGPLVTEDRRWGARVPEPHNGTGEWQGAFRSGPFDAVAHRYAIEVCGGIDGLAVTHADAVRPGFRVCRAYRTPGTDDTVTALPVSPRPDLEFQRVLTKTVSGLEPVLGDGPSAAGEWPEFLAGELGAPLKLVSSGPEWTRKVLIGK